MKPWLRNWIGVLLLLFLVACKQNRGDRKLGEVVRIADGDTFTLLYAGNEQVKVRLYGIDSPERAQAFGTAARKALGEMLEGHRVYVAEKDRDRYGRLVAIAFRDDDLNINEEMLRQGFAWHYSDYDNNPEWALLQQKAKEARLGLWKDARPMPPWDFRKQKRKKTTAR